MNRTPADLEEAFRRAREEQWDKTPEDIKELGAILRKCVVGDGVDGDVNALATFLDQHEIKFDRDRLEELRDVLVISRIDLKDLEPDVRERLRARTLAGDDPKMMTPDYADAATVSGGLPRCRDCRWFVTPPGGDEPHADKACVAFGTKGADQACFGFTKIPT